VKHTNSSEAKVELFVLGGSIDLCVSDAGPGFNPESVQTKGGLGLISMRERLESIGGQLVIQSHPPYGTRIRVRVPLSDGSPQSPGETKYSKANA